MDKERNYRIDIGAYGSICIEAPTKEEYRELFREVTSTKCESRESSRQYAKLFC